MVLVHWNSIKLQSQGLLNFENHRDPLLIIHRAPQLAAEQCCLMQCCVHAHLPLTLLCNVFLSIIIHLQPPDPNPHDSPSFR